MGDTLSETRQRGEANSDGGRRQATEDRQMFQCPLCDARRVASAIRYDELGYAVCPVCSYVAGP